MYLKRCTGQNESIASMIKLAKHLDKSRVGVLHAVTFINNQMQPTDLAKNRAILDDVLKGRKKHLEFTETDIRLQRLSNIGGSLVYNGLDIWSPL